MTKLAWISKEKKVLALGLLAALLAVAGNLVNLYVSPGILSAVERHASIGELLLTILAFTLGIMLVSAASAYVNENISYGRISVRIDHLLSESGQWGIQKSSGKGKLRHLYQSGRGGSHMADFDGTAYQYHWFPDLPEPALCSLPYVDLRDFRHFSHQLLYRQLCRRVRLPAP